MNFFEKVEKYAVSRNTNICSNCGSPDLLYGLGSNCLNCEHPTSNEKPVLEILQYSIHVLNIFVSNYNTFAPQNTVRLKETLNRADSDLSDENLAQLKIELSRIKCLGYLETGFISVPDTQMHVNAQKITEENQNIVLELGILIGVLSFIKKFKANPKINSPKSSTIVSEEVSNKITMANENNTSRQKLMYWLKKRKVVIGIIILIFALLNPDMKRFNEYRGTDDHDIIRPYNFIIFSIYKDKYESGEKYLGIFSNFISLNENE